jgi:hypothetical protein
MNCLFPWRTERITVDCPKVPTTPKRLAIYADVFSSSNEIQLMNEIIDTKLHGSQLLHSLPRGVPRHV